MIQYYKHSSRTEAEDFSSNPCVQTGSGAHPASYTVGTGGSFPGGKARPGRDADHSPPLLPNVIRGVHRDHFTFTTKDIPSGNAM
jgi:hypothetical protein